MLPGTGKGHRDAGFGGRTGLWEDIAGRVGDIATIRELRRNIAAFEPDTATAHTVWNSPNPPDAWIALASEHGAHPDESDAIQLDPKLAIVRDAGIVLTHGKWQAIGKGLLRFCPFPGGFGYFQELGLVELMPAFKGCSGHDLVAA